MHNEEKLKNPIEFMGKCGGLPGKMDRALEKSGERGRDFLCCFFPEEPLYYILYTMETIYANGGLRLKHCNLSTIPKKGAQNQAP